MTKNKTAKKMILGLLPALAGGGGGAALLFALLIAIATSGMFACKWGD